MVRVARVLIVGIGLWLLPLVSIVLTRPRRAVLLIAWPFAGLLWLLALRVLLLLLLQECQQVIRN